MRSLRWVIIAGAIVVGLVALAIAIGALWLNSFIHSPAFKTELEARASQTLGGTVQIQAVDFDILHGIKLQGLVAQLDASHAGGQGALQMQVASVNCAYSWSDLFQRKLRLTGVTLDQPQIILTKQAMAPMAPAGNDTVTSAGASATGETSGASMPFQFVLDRAKVRSGSLSIRDAAGTSMVELKDINADADTSGYSDNKDVTGSLRIGTASASNLPVTNFSTPFTYHANMIDAKPFDASAFGGRLAGGYSLGGSGPSVLDLNAKGLDVAQLTTATMSNSSAKLSGSLDFNSKWRAIESSDMNGEGDALMSNGKLEGVKILQEVGRVLKIKELEEPIITSAKTHFVVADRQTKFIGLQMISPLFQITGDGVVGFDGGVNANLVLILTRDAMGRLPREVGSSFVQQQDGTGSIAFQVTGTTANPQTDLATRLLLQNTQIKNVINKALNKFFH